MRKAVAKLSSSMFIRKPQRRARAGDFSCAAARANARARRRRKPQRHPAAVSKTTRVADKAPITAEPAGQLEVEPQGLALVPPWPLAPGAHSPTCRAAARRRPGEPGHRRAAVREDQPIGKNLLRGWLAAFGAGPRAERPGPPAAPSASALPKRHGQLGPPSTRPSGRLPGDGRGSRGRRSLRRRAPRASGPRLSWLPARGVPRRSSRRSRVRVR